MKRHRILFSLILLAAAAPATQPEIRHGFPMAGTPPERSRRFFGRLATLAEPTGHPDPARLASYLALLKREVIHDPRLVAFLPSAEAHDDTIILTGFAEYAELKTTAEKYLQTLGFAHIENRMELLPALTDKPFALVIGSKAFLYDKPEKPHETLTQALIGDGLFLLRKEGDSYLCHSPDGYLGYIAAADVNPIDADAMRNALTAERVTFVRDFHRGDTFLPAGAHLRVGSSNVDVPPDAISMDHSAPDRIEKIIATAKPFLGAHYVWGGRTTAGVDCSGLIHASYQSQGIILPRDADQQALCGTLVATRTFRSALRRGDLLFFISARGAIHHVALYLGDNKFIEAAEPVVTISSFNPKDKNYSEKRDKSFGFAKRILE